ncbi:TonB-dependent receptor plug domain-containing protein [Persicimonas caeni]|uniref:TonB-dependent receptor plug domain-containing protein n=1 Tax=Persicimonas caeni TaxID=2292766 RepID=UPI00143CF5B7|nr:TonB-dependent receptor [Persicimonas caeni]
MKKPSHIPTCLLATLLLAPGLARAEDAEEPDENTVKTVSPKERSVDDARLPSGFVTRVEVDEATGSGRDLGDELERVPGVTVRQTSSFGRPAFATVRGGNSRQLAVSLNGMRISAPAGVGFDVGSLSLAGVEAVDVYRGAAGAVHGAGALSGALDLRTRLPKNDAGWQGAATGLGGSYATYGVFGHTAYGGESYAVRLDAGWRQSEGDFAFVDRQGTAQERVNNDHRQLSVLAAGRVDVGEGHLEPLVMYDGGSGGAPGPSESPERFDEARVDQRRLVGQLAWRQRNLAAGDWGAMDARAMAGYGRRDTDYDNPESYLGGAQISDTSTLHTFEVDAQASTFFAFGDILHLTLEGRRQSYEAAHEEVFADATDRSSIEASRLSLAAGVSNELLLAGDAVSLVAALRLEHLKDARQAAADRAWTPLMPSVGAIWRAHRWLEFKSNLARTFRAPDFDELYLRMAGLEGNPDLAPERALSADAGVRLGPEEGPVSLEAIYFRNALDESIYFVAVSAWKFQAQNLGAGTSQGVETTLSVRPSERVDLLASYTLTDATLDGLPDGVTLLGQPVHQGSVRAEVELGGLGPFDGVSSMRLFGEGFWRSRVYFDNFGHISNPPFWTADLGAAFAPVDWVELTFNARNLADNRRGADSLQRPLPGRAFYGAVSVEFGE